MLLRIGVDDCRAVLPGKRHEARVSKALVPHFDRMLERHAANRQRQEAKKGADILRVESLGRRQLPEDRPELVAQFGDPAFQKPVDALAGFGELPAGITMSINASPDTIASGRLWGALDRANLHRTIVEVTEHAHVADHAPLDRRLAELRRVGVRIAIDDAGAGYSGLQQIVQVAPDLIKMDMSLTRGIDGDGARRALASAMVYYARETGATIVAEGIETQEELATLRTLGAARGQGYLLGRPMRLEAIDFGMGGERKGAA